MQGDLLRRNKTEIVKDIITYIDTIIDIAIIVVVSTASIGIVSIAMSEVVIA